MAKRAGLFATPRVGMKRSSPTGSSDLSLSLQTLDEDTMTQACSLLLSERDYQDDSGEGPSDYDKLVTIFVKCRDAAISIERQVSAMPSGMPALPIPSSASATTPSARLAAKKKAQSVLNTMSPPRRMSLAQLARAGPGPAGVGRGKLAPVGGKLAPASRPTLKRETSDSSIASVASVASVGSTSSRPAAKKQRTQSTHNQTFEQGGRKATAPPPEALNFLQALNSQQKQKKKEKQKKEEKQQKQKEREPSPSPPEEGRTSHARAAKSASISKPQGKRSSPRKR